MATLLDARPAGTPPGKRNMGVVSPDKTEASTPPHSPDRATDESAMYSNTPAVAARHGIRSSSGGGGGGLAAVDEGLPSPPPAGAPAHDLAADPPKKGKKAPLLGVNRILCRAPSNESNISDLSASLSPGGPRGAAADPFAKGPASQRSEGEHLLASLLNDCGVLPAVTDLLEEAGLGSAALGTAGASALPVVSPSASEGAVSGVSAATGTASKSAPKYETPAVWGVAPDDDDDGSAAPATPGTGGSKASPGNHAREDSVEYDNVELVLDEAVPAPELDKAEATPRGGFGLSKLRRPPSLPKQASNSDDGRKSPAGILKLRSKRSKTPSPANVPEVTMGAAVVESNRDPRISHTYDIANFDNEELRPSVDASKRGDTPVSVPSAGSRAATPVSPLAMESPSRAAGVTDPGTPSRVELALASGAVNNDEREAKKKSLLKGLRIKPKKGHKRSTSVPSMGGGYQTPQRGSQGGAVPTAKDDTALVAPAPSTPKPTQAQIEEATKWKATADKTSGKAYYYRRDTKEVRWDKPPGFDEAMVIKKIRDGAAGSPATVPAPSGKGPKAQSGKKVADASAGKGGKAKSKRGFGLGRSKAKAAAKEAAAAAANAKAEQAAKDLADKNRERSEHWRATTDPSTGKTYYYNKKTKEVSWSKPAGYEEKGGKKEAVKETAAMTSVADKRKKGAWFKQGSGSSKSDKGDGDGAVAEEKDTKEDAALAEAKHWRAAQDPGTGKVYYFNKKTKLVQWTKPECFEWKEKMERQAKAATAEGATEEAKVEPEAGAEAETAGEEGAPEEDPSEMEAFSDDEAADKPVAPAASAEDAPFDEPDAPFDEPFDEPASPKQPLCYTADPLPSPKRAHFGPSSPRDDDSAEEEEDSEEVEERKDSFDEDDHAAPVASEPLYGRVKSLASINFNGRSRTFASQMTDTTKKAGNRGSGPDDANARIASEIAVAPPQEPMTVARRLKERELPPPPKRSSHHRTYGGKKAENLGDSSIESIEEESREGAQREEWTDDDVSALSGIGNESLEGKKKRRARARKAAARQEAPQQERAPATDNAKEWTQEELDSFIAKNDWPSVSRYINEMRVAKGPRDRLADEGGPSVREVRERRARDRRAGDRDASPPRAAFGARSRLQHDGQASEESESVWQSLSSASYEEGSEAESSYDRRRGSGRRRSSPRERMM